MSQSTYIADRQLSILDPVLSMSERDKKRLEQGWAGTFYREILPKLGSIEHHFAPLYSELPNSRPSTPTYLVLAFFLLKALYNLTDEQLIDRIKFGIDYQYALGTTSLECQPINQRTLNRFRAAVSLYFEETGIDLLGEFFDDFASQLVSQFIGKKRMRRMDSVMIDNGCRKLSRLQTAHVVIRSALDLVEESGLPIQDNLKHYTEDFDENKVTYHDHRPAAEKKEEAFKDAFDLYQSYPDQLKEKEEYKLLERFVKEQIRQTEAGEYEGIKPGSELTSTTMNTPVDPESTIRKKAGETHQGYVGNFAETVDLESNRKIIDSADLKANIYSDSQFAKDEIAKMAERQDTSPLVTDGAYASVDNVNLAKEAGIDLRGTDLAGKQTPDMLADFEIDEEAGTVTCPNHQVSKKATLSSKDESYWVSFDKKICETCPLRDQCPLKMRKRVRSGKVSAKMIQRAKLQRTIHAKTYQANYRFRNGVEAIPSQLRRNQKIDTMPYRGLVRKKIGYLAAILGINVRRAIRYAMEDAQKASQSHIESIFGLLFVIFFGYSQASPKFRTFQRRTV